MVRIFYKLIARPSAQTTLTGHLMTWTLSARGAPKQGLDQDNLAQEMTKTNNNITVVLRC